ncbi:MAG: hypothetical protein Q4C12_06840 [Clostridia bacterium]|nr:hypothetical protein [Clostridia bacterium]
MKRLIAAALCAFFAAAFLTGCEGHNLTLWNAMQKSSEILSGESDTQISAAVTIYEAFDDAQMQDVLERIGYFLADTKLAVKSKSVLTDDAIKAYSEAVLEMEGMKVSADMWVDMPDITDAASAKVYFKVPAYIGALLPEEYGKKPYLLFDYSKISAITQQVPDMEINMDKLDSKKIIALSKDLMREIGSYINPPEAFVSSVNGNIYTVTITEDNLLACVKSMLENFSQDAATRNFYKKYISEFYNIYHEYMPSVYPEVDFDSAFEAMEPILPLVPASADMLIGVLKEADIFGDGWSVAYTIDEQGFISAENWDIDIRINLSKLAKFGDAFNRLVFGMMTGEPLRDGEQKGIFGINVKIATSVKNINEEMEVTMPSSDPHQTVDFIDATISAMQKAKEEAKWNYGAASVGETGTINNYLTNGVSFMAQTLYPTYSADSGELFFPAKETLETLGCSVKWNEEESCVEIETAENVYCIYNTPGDYFVDYYYTVWENGKCYLNLYALELVTGKDFGFDSGELLIR